MVLKEEFHPTVASARDGIRVVRQAVTELQACEQLHKVIHLVLKAGNYMNAGGHAGNAAGFKITSLLKLADTRANKPGMSLMHFVVMEAQKLDPSLLSFPDKLVHIEEAKRLSVETMELELENLSQKIASLRQKVRADPQLSLQMDSFFQEASRTMAELGRRRTVLRADTRSLASFLCEDEEGFSLQECFGIFHSFCAKVRNAIKENREREMNELRQQRTREASSLPPGAKRRSLAFPADEPVPRGSGSGSGGEADPEQAPPESPDAGTSPVTPVSPMLALSRTSVGSTNARRSRRLPSELGGRDLLHFLHASPPVSPPVTAAGEPSERDFDGDREREHRPLEKSSSLRRSGDLVRGQRATSLTNRLAWRDEDAERPLGRAVERSSSSSAGCGETVARRYDWEGVTARPYRRSANIGGGVSGAISDLEKALGIALGAAHNDTRSASPVAGTAPWAAPVARRYGRVEPVTSEPDVASAAPDRRQDGATAPSPSATKYDRINGVVERRELVKGLKSYDGAVVEVTPQQPESAAGDTEEPGDVVLVDLETTKDALPETRRAVAEPAQEIDAGPAPMTERAADVPAPAGSDKPDAEVQMVYYVRGSQPNAPTTETPGAGKDFRGGSPDLAVINEASQASETGESCCSDEAVERRVSLDSAEEEAPASAPSEHHDQPAPTDDPREELDTEVAPKAREEPRRETPPPVVGLRQVKSKVAAFVQRTRSYNVPAEPIRPRPVGGASSSGAVTMKPASNRTTFSTSATASPAKPVKAASVKEKPDTSSYLQRGSPFRRSVMSPNPKSPPPPPSDRKPDVERGGCRKPQPALSVPDVRDGASSVERKNPASKLRATSGAGGSTTDVRGPLNRSDRLRATVRVKAGAPVEGPRPSASRPSSAVERSQSFGVSARKPPEGGNKVTRSESQRTDGKGATSPTSPTSPVCLDHSRQVKSPDLKAGFVVRLSAVTPKHGLTRNHLSASSSQLGPRKSSSSSSDLPALSRHCGPTARTDGPQAGPRDGTVSPASSDGPRNLSVRAAARVAVAAAATLKPAIGIRRTSSEKCSPTDNRPGRPLWK
ncbi:FH2 domain-containing protein 1 isoform X2 [Lampetra planeri]